MPRSARLAAATVANLVILLPLGLAAAIEGRLPDLYYRLLQEDEIVEWATVWAFLGAAALYAWIGARRLGRRRLAAAWFPLALAAFCLFVAGEEISWGQRLLGFRPPSYFLAENFQQELNLHNVVATSLRKQALLAVVLGFGVALPLVAAPRALRRRLAALGVAAPPLELAPAFAATGWLYEAYPWKFTGEIVELMLGVGFLVASLAAWRGTAEGGRPARSADQASDARAAPPAAAWSLGSAATVGLLALATLAAAQAATRDDPVMTRLVETELEALKRDILSAGRGKRDDLPTRCGLHRRVYTWVERDGVDELTRGAFSRLAERGTTEERARFFLDPWNGPYWIRDKCAAGGRRRAVFVYSFGPNRKRDSSEWELGGDDLGAFVLRRP